MTQAFQLTHPDKVFWPNEGYTKGDVARYYRQISPVILPYLKNRPENLKRHPSGIKGPFFFQKDLRKTPAAGIQVEKIFSEFTLKKINYLICQNRRTLEYMVNLGCIEINPWHSRINHLDRPDWLVFDLDPEKISFDKVIKTAQEIHAVLDQIGTKNFCKTSGKRGLHIYVPLGARYTTDQAKQFAYLIAIVVTARLPKITSIKRRPDMRQGKVYIDYLQNNAGQTLAAPYSLRAVRGATVATPLDWHEVKPGLDPKKFTIQTIFGRLKSRGDIFRPILGAGINLQKCLTRLEKL